MSGISDIRMYVEHLFEGRTLDAETIELKEEIYGNLVARYEDYLAQGMDEAEAYRRTCEAVTSVEDVMGEKDAEEKDDPLDATVVAPAASPADAGGTPPAPTAGPASETGLAPRRWPTGAIVAVVVAILLVAGIGSCAAFNLLDTQRALDDYQSQTSQTIQQQDQPDDTTYIENTTSPNETAPAPEATTVDEETLLVTDELDDLILTNDPSSYATLAQGSALDVMNSLPLGYHVTAVGTGTRSDELLTDYAFGKDERFAYFDDDALERALAYDAAAVFCSMPNVSTWTVTLTETDLEDRDVDVDRYSFRRSDLEHLLDVTLDESQLDPTAWNALRDQLMEKRIWDEATDRAERD